MKLKESRTNFLLVPASILILFICLEISARIFISPRDLIMHNDLVSGSFKNLYDYDSRLGWTLKPNASAPKWDVTVHTTPDGLRSNDNLEFSALEESFKILALGDSMTFGDEVADRDTWPAQLEIALNAQAPKAPIRVLNGGVSSYGFDQMLLRAEELVPKYHPSVIIVGFIAEDLVRTYQSVRHGVGKPYFVVKHGALELKNAPVPIRSPLLSKKTAETLHHSRLVSFFINRIVLSHLRQGSLNDYEHIDDSDNLETCKAITRKFIALARENQARLLIVFMEGYQEEYSALHPFLNFLEELSPREMLFLNYSKSLSAFRNHSEQDYRSLYNTRWDKHWNQKGHYRFSQSLEPIVLNFFQKQ